MLDFRILGPLEVWDDDRPVRLGGPRQRSTLALLLLNANRVVSVERLADELYAGAAPATAVTQVQRQVSELRKALDGPDLIQTAAPGYAITAAPEQIDLGRFELRADDGRRALERGEPERARDLLAGALDLFRGAPLADLEDAPFARSAIGRLEEIRLAALEHRIDADLALGRHGAIVGELEQLVREHPLREAFCAQLMLAYYRQGRQTDALDTYRRTRERLVDGFGLEPTPALQQLERAILTHDPSIDLTPDAARPSVERRSLLAVPSADDRVEDLLAVADPLGADRELILARLVADESRLAPALAALRARRPSRSAVRTTAFTTEHAAAEVVRLTEAYDVELVLVDSAADAVDGTLRELFERCPADVGVLFGSPGTIDPSAEVYVPFSGAVDDWAAFELAASLALVTGARLRLVGTKAAPGGRRDATRMLADASLAVQRVCGVEPELLLLEPSPDALVAAAEAAALVVVGTSARWKQEGMGAVRTELIRRSRAVLVVHRGPRPGRLAPSGSRTRFSWSV